MKNEIRKIALQPGSGDSVVEVEIVHVFLDDNPTYEALSYVWGDPTATKALHILGEAGQRRDSDSSARPQISREESTIDDLGHPRIDDKVPLRVDSNSTADCGVYIFKATANLESALRRLRFVDKPRYLWADAICINQNDLDERCQQVGIMGSIYAEASRVIIWLGHDEEHLGPELQQMVSGYDMLDSLSQSQTDAVAGLLKSAWFTRVWVIQEAALSQSPYVLWGETEISWRSLVFLLKKIGDQRTAVGDLWNKVGVEWNFWLAHHAYNPSKQSLLHLVRILYAARGHSATDPRDHVYAFLGHPANSLDGRALLRAEYTKTRAEVFRDTTIRFLRSMGNLDVLSYVTHDECLHLQDGLPSWVPVWDCLPLMTTGFDVRVFPFSESGLSQEEIRGVSKDTLIDVSDEDRILSLRGFEADAVEWHSDTIIYKMIPPGLWDCGKVEHPLERLWTDLRCHYSGKPYEEDFLKLFSLLLTSGLIRKDKAESRIDEHNANFQAWRLEHSKNLQPEAGELFPPRDQQGFSMLQKAAEGGTSAQFVSDAFRACNGRKIFFTKNGHLGLGPMATRPGDISAILSAARTPFILRPAGDQYILVGEAYLHGLMHDAVVTKWKRGQLGDKLFRIV